MSIRLSIKDDNGLQGLKKIIDSTYGKIANADYAAKAEVIRDELVFLLSEEAPYNKSPNRKAKSAPPPGSLKAGFYGTVSGGSRHVQISFYSKVDYANYVENGHTAINGRWVEPNPYIERAVERLLPMLQEILLAGLI